MKKKFRIGLLTTIESPLLPFFIDRILIEKLNDIVVICDSKTISDKDKKIWLERTSETFDLGKYKKTNIYKFDAEKIPFYFVKNHNHKNSIQLVKSLKLDVLLNAGTPRKLSKNILKSTRHGVINVHPGLLPEYRGCSAVEWAIYNDEKVGNTAHFMTEEYDEGPIIKSESYNFLPDDDYKSIRSKVYKNGCVLAAKTLKIIKKKKIVIDDGVAQNQSKSKFWKPIPNHLLKKVIKKIDNGKYFYKKKNN